MAMITKQEEGRFLTLFNREGYVLNFSTNEFDVFTMDSIGVPLCEAYGLSKGKSLIAYLKDSPAENRQKLILDLFRYYEENMEYEYNKDYQPDSFSTRYFSGYSEKYAKIYKECKEIADKLKPISFVINKTADSLKQKFSSDYLTKQIELMISMQKNNPTNAIGMAKELIESCCKTILDELGITWSKKDNVSQLTTKTIDALDLLPSGIQEENVKGEEAIKAVLGNLRAMPQKLSEIRNDFGSGHGKSASFQGLEERHAKLAVGCSITFVEFVWSTYEEKHHNN